jgi:DNA helicase IV
MAKRSFYVKDSELDDYQVKVINKKTDNSYIVKGCAGSGKSILALWKAKQIQDEHRGSYMYIVFTKALMQYMADGIKEVGISQRNVDYHWHWVNRAGCPSADYIIVDEAQDFSKEDIELFKSKARKALLLYGDSAQQLYTFIQDKKTVSMEDIQYFTKFPVEQLVFNHRLPKKIARVAQYINSENDELYVSSLDFNADADGVAVDTAYVGNDQYNDISATLGKGKKSIGYVFYEVPVSSKKITITYNPNFWTDGNAIEFIVQE